MAITSSSSALRLYMKEYLPLFIFVSVLFLMGVFFGAMLVNALSLEQKQDLSSYLGSFFQTVEQGVEMEGRQPFLQTFITHLKWLALIWLFGISVIGLPLILILDFLKGVVIGFTVGYLVGQLSWKGFLFAIVSVAPQNLLIIPTILICSVSAIAFSIYMVKSRFLQRKGLIGQSFISYSTMAIAFTVVILCASLFEAYVSPVLMKWVTPVLLAL